MVLDVSHELNIELRVKGYVVVEEVQEYEASGTLVLSSTRVVGSTKGSGPSLEKR